MPTALPSPSPAIVVRAGTPAAVVSVVVPVVAICLVALRAASTGLASGPDDPVSPWIVAVATIGVGAWLGWRSPRQRAELRPAELRCRNLASSFAVDWERIDAIVVSQRGPVVVVDVRVRGLRRRLRVGAATRFVGPHAHTVSDQLLAHPRVGDLLLDTRPGSGR